MSLPAWAREPVVHFIAAGAMLYAVLIMAGSETVDPASRTIDVDREQRAILAVQFERNFGRPPSDAELDSQVERFVRDEILYREALRLGLDQGDPVVRQRLISKMDMTAGAALEAAEPSDAELEKWLAAYPDRFAQPAQFTFDQIFFNEQTDASRFLTIAPPQGQQDWRERGDPISLPDSVFEQPESEIAARFGRQFADQLAGLDAIGKWAGPIPSGFGWHAVRIRKAEQPGAPLLSDVREQVTDDWRRDRIAERKERAYAILREAYRVKIDR